MIKKFVLWCLIILPKIGLACSSCNVEFSEDEKKSYLIATGMLVVIPFVLLWYLVKFHKKNYK